MRDIILTKRVQDGEWLKAALVRFDKSFADIPVMTKDIIQASPSPVGDTSRIFSTWYMPLFSVEEVTELFPSLKELYYAAGTVKYFIEPFLKNGVRVFSAAKVNGIPVAEYVAAQIVLANKGYYQAQRSYKSILWKINFVRSRNYAESHVGNYDSKVGLVGFGYVGRQVAKMLKPYRLLVFAYDPYVSDDVLVEAGVTRMELTELFRDCDVISNHLPDVPATKGMLNASLFSLMKDNVTFINTGRGAQVDEKDLSRALRKRCNACAVLDVTSHEPVFPWSPLLWNRNVFISPHIAGSLAQERLRLVEQMVAAADKISKGEHSEYEVRLEQLVHQA